MPTIGTTSHDLYLSQKSLPPKKENKLSRLLANKEDEDICNESSFRCYYEGSAGVAVPFIWESIPGTPKHSLFSDNYYSNMPPLTPPPSYQSKNVVVNMTNKSSSISMQQNQTSSSKNNNRLLLRSIFGHRNVSPLSLTSSSSISSFSSSSYDSSSHSSTPKSFTTSNKKKNNSIFHRRWSSLSSSRPRSPLHFAEDDEEHTTTTLRSPNSTLCFAVGPRNNTQQQGFRGCFQWRI